MEEYYIGINGSFHDTSVCVLASNREEPILLLSEDRHSGTSHHFGFPFKSMSIAAQRVCNGKVLGIGYSRDKECFRSPHEEYFADILNEEQERITRQGLHLIFLELENIGIEPKRLQARMDDLLIATKVALENRNIFKKRINYLLCKFANELITERNIRQFFPGVPITPINHHYAHAAAFFCSPFDDATVISWDGRGEFDTTVLWRGHNNQLTRLSNIRHPKSLGSFYELFSQICGFDSVSGPGKLMGLASYGDSRYVDIIGQCIKVEDDAFDFHFEPSLLISSQNEPLRPSAELLKLVGKIRSPNIAINEHYKAIAFAAQATLERVCTELVLRARSITDCSDFVFSGGLALNCVMNEKLRRDAGVNAFFLPACGDDGTAPGAALVLRREAVINRGAGERRFSYSGGYGTTNKNSDVKKLVNYLGLIVEKNDSGKVATYLSKNNVIGYISGRYEFGPRALGFRSILADPRPLENWPRINRKIKFREDFRPFAPIMLMEDAIKFWGTETKPTESPYMLLAPSLSEVLRKDLGAVTHVDGTARIQTLNKLDNAELFEIISEFKKLTGIGVLLNTSLNMTGESIIVDAEDLIYFLAASGLDAIVIDDLFIRKDSNSAVLASILMSIGGRNGYLLRRRKRYDEFLVENKFEQKFIGYNEFFQLAFGEVAPSPLLLK